MLGYGFWTIEKKQTGERIGEAGFVEGRREIKPSLKGVPEIGWGIHPDEQGKGYALEAATAALNWGIQHFKGQPIRCIIAPENAPSIRLAEKLGFKELVSTTYKDQPIIMFERR
jgi:RimJ/RimL family protein N-acetyltransferase